MQIKLDEGAYAPQRAHRTDAGYDLRSREEAYIPTGGSHIFHTGVHVRLPIGHAGVIIAKSGLNTVHGITSTGLVDEGYTGEIIVKLYNNGETGYFVRRGDKISQMIVVPVVQDEIELVDALEETERGDSGFGSTGR